MKGKTDCLRIILRAEMRMANEIDRSQAAGELAKQGRPEENRQSSAVYSDLGVDHRRVGEWCEVRDAHEKRWARQKRILHCVTSNGAFHVERFVLGPV